MEDTQLCNIKLYLGQEYACLVPYQANLLFHPISLIKQLLEDVMTWMLTIGQLFEAI